jgi:hypothetical protein
VRNFTSRSLSLIGLTSLPRSASCESVWVVPSAVAISTDAAMVENAESRSTSTLPRSASTFGSHTQGVGELVEPGLAGHHGGGDRVLHADLRLPPDVGGNDVEFETEAGLRRRRVEPRGKDEAGKRRQHAMFTKVRKASRSVLMPESFAAFALPPTAQICRPMTVRVVTKA